jgi:hypothetical protein
MKIKQMIIILFIGMGLLLSLSAAVADEIERTSEELPTDQEVIEDDGEFEEPLIAPAPNSEELGDNTEYDNVVGDDLPDDTPHILDVSNGDYDPNEAFGLDDSTTESDKVVQTSSLGIPVSIAVVLAGIIIIGLIFVKRR